MTHRGRSKATLWLLGQANDECTMLFRPSPLKVYGYQIDLSVETSGCSCKLNVNTDSNNLNNTSSDLYCNDGSFVHAWVGGDVIA